MQPYRNVNPLMRLAKSLVPDHERYLRVMRGPFRGARFFANPRFSLRKVAGLYEAELNGWIDEAMQRTDLVLDVGGNDGYFAFGAAAAMRRAGHEPRVVTFEPLPGHVRQLEAAKRLQGYTDRQVRVVNTLVGTIDDERFTTLDSLHALYGDCACPLIKIDVEGAEIDVLEGASKWITPATLLVIEVHKHEYIQQIQTMLAGRTGPLRLVEQKALPILGREMRDVNNWWLVSELS